MEDHGDRYGDRLNERRRLRRQSGLSDNDIPEYPEAPDHLGEGLDEAFEDRPDERLDERLDERADEPLDDPLEAPDFDEPGGSGGGRPEAGPGAVPGSVPGGSPGASPGARGPGGLSEPAGAATGAAAGAAGSGFEDRKDQYTIGEVVGRLRREFPTLSVSKVRYLERRRLINLTRTRGGYRLFSPQDVEMLRYILTLQDKEYLPLKVIKKRIDAGAPSSLSQEGGEFSHILEDRTYTRDELAESLEVEARFVDDLLSVQVIGRTGEISQKDAEIARMALELSRYGIQPRHLRGIMAGVEREAAMFKQILNPELRSGDEQRVAEAMQKARQLASIDSRLKELMMANIVDNFSS